MNPLRSLTLMALCGSIPAGSALAQDLTKRPGPQDLPVALVHGRVHTISGDDIADGYVIFEKGVITDVGSMAGGRVFAATIKQIDCKGKHVYPGLISPATQMGLIEHGMTRPAMDHNEVGDITPEACAVVAVNPDTTLIPVARANGILFCGVMPTGGVLPGQASVIRLEGWTWEDMAVKRSAGQCLSWPFMRTVTAAWMDRSEEDQRRDNSRNLDRVKDAFRAAKAYLAAKDGPDGAAVPTDLRWEAMRGVMGKAKTQEGKHASQDLLFISATDYDQITTSVAWAIQEGLKPVIVGGRDSHLCAALLKEHDVPVIINSTISMPRRDDSPVDEAFSLPAKLQSAGVRWCLASGEETAHERNLPYAAAIASAYGGLDPRLALRGITLSTAEILGVADRIGSIDRGKEATLFICDGDALEVTSKVDALFIQGKQLSTTNKQSELAEKYREKYRQQRGRNGSQPISSGDHMR